VELLNLNIEFANVELFRGVKYFVIGELALRLQPVRTTSCCCDVPCHMCADLEEEYVLQLSAAFNLQPGMSAAAFEAAIRGYAAVGSSECAAMCAAVAAHAPATATMAFHASVLAYLLEHEAADTSADTVPATDMLVQWLSLLLTCCKTGLPAVSSSVLDESDGRWYAAINAAGRSCSAVVQCLGFHCGTDRADDNIGNAADVNSSGGSSSSSSSAAFDVLAGPLRAQLGTIAVPLVAALLSAVSPAASTSSTAAGAAGSSAAAEGTAATQQPRNSAAKAVAAAMLSPWLALLARCAAAGSSSSRCAIIRCNSVRAAAATPDAGAAGNAAMP
jgi:hypothetical protein